MNALIGTITDAELAYIASLDYGVDASKHEAELRSLIFVQNGEFRSGQYWHPHEVLSLGSNGFISGHEREFAICTLLLINAVCAGSDPITDLVTKFDDHAEDYDKLPADLRNEIVAAFEAAKI